MADAKISALASHGTPVAADYVASVLDSGPTSKKLLLSDLQNFVLQAFGGGSEISVTTTTTATIGRMHHCTGTSGDYTVTLPAASGNAGKMIGFRMGAAAALTKLVTIDGNASETIDGATTRIMWATETAILLCDGSNWFKVAGKTVPMEVRLSRSADLTGINAATWFAATVPTKDFGIAQMQDAGNERATIVRPGRYLCSAYAYVNRLTGTATYAYVGFYVNTSAPSTYTQATAVGSGGYAAVGVYAMEENFAAGDYIRIGVYTDATTAQILGAGGALLSVVEVPQW